MEYWEILCHFPKALQFHNPITPLLQYSILLFPMTRQLRRIDPDESQDLIAGVNDLMKLSWGVINADPRL
jgi:hypothetical protein